MTLSRSLSRALPLLLAGAFLGAFAGPSFAEGPTGPSGPPMAPCEPGQFPTPEKPCALPPCPEGTSPTREKPCAGMPGGPGPGPGGAGGAPCGPGPGGPAPTGTPPSGGPDAVKSAEGPGGPGGGPGGGCEPPDMDRGFMNRVWKFVGEVDGYDDGVLSITVAKILNLPKKYADEKEEIVDEDARVLLSGSTRIYKDGKRVKAADLDDAENVRVQGKMLPTSKWRKDDDDQPVPTIRAKKVYITG